MIRSIAHKVLPTLLLLTVMLPTTASAQERIDWEATIALNGAITTSTSAVLLFGTLQPVLSTTSSVADVLFADVGHAQRYMNENAVALSQDIAIGAGHTVQDLAQMAGMVDGDMDALGRAMRTERVALLEILSKDHVTLKDVYEFSSLLKGAMHRAG